MEKEQVYDLLDLKYHNVDMFYRVLTKMPVDELNQLCSENRGFHHLCRKKEFWKSLWAQKLPFPVEELNLPFLRSQYLKYASMLDLAKYIHSHLDDWRRVFSGTEKNIFDELLSLSPYNVDEQNTSQSKMVKTIFDHGLEENNLDCLFLAVNKEYQLQNSTFMFSREAASSRFMPIITEGLHNGNLFDRLFSLLDKAQTIFFLEGLSLEDVIAIPSERDDCQVDLLEKVYEEKWTQFQINNYYSSELYHYFFFPIFLVASEKKCLKLFDFLIEKLLSLETGIRKDVVYHLTQSLMKSKSSYLNRFISKFEAGDGKEIETGKREFKRGSKIESNNEPEEEEP